MKRRKCHEDFFFSKLQLSENQTWPVLDLRSGHHKEQMSREKKTSLISPLLEVIKIAIKFLKYRENINMKSLARSLKN